MTEMTKYPVHNFIDLTGKRFGKLTVIKRIEDKVLSSGTKKTQWLCRCDCGNYTRVIGESLKRKNGTKSCGCLIVKSTIKRSTRHGMRYTRIYSIYCDMKKRCYNAKTRGYKHYGGKGIRICDEWLNDFMTFYEWSMLHGYKDNLSIDRINSAGDYEPMNCQWITRSDNTKRRNAEYWRGKHENKVG